MLRIIDSWGIPNNDGTTCAPFDHPKDMEYPVWNGEWVSNPAHYAEREAYVPVPQSVTMRQARLALHAAGLLTSVDAAIASMAEPDKSVAQITWDYASTVDRGFGMVPQLAAAFGMTEQQIDDLFIAAAQL